jgi:spermine oxidase
LIHTKIFPQKFSAGFSRGVSSRGIFPQKIPAGNFRGILDPKIRYISPEKFIEILIYFLLNYFFFINFSTNIKWNPALATDKATVSCSDGTSYTADHVIFTGSLGVLKARHTTLFNPKLPDIKVKAIESMGFGTLGKVFLEFEEPFWPTDVNEFVAYTFLWTDNVLKQGKTSDKAWTIDLIGFSRVDGFPNLLEGLIAGRRISELEALNDTKLIDDSMWLLQKFLGKTLPRPKSMKRTRWMTSRNFLGSYSYPSMAAEANKVLPKTLGQSLTNIANKPVILFAGEATDELFSSYAHGAVASGWRAGNELAVYLTK